MAFVEMDFASGGSENNFIEGSVTLSTTREVTVDLGFKPRMLIMHQGTSRLCVYDEVRSTTKYYYINSSNALTVQTMPVASTATNVLKNITDNGFVMNTSSEGGALVYDYVAIK